MTIHQAKGLEFLSSSSARCTISFPRDNKSTGICSLSSNARPSSRRIASPSLTECAFTTWRFPARRRCCSSLARRLRRTGLARRPNCPVAHEGQAPLHGSGGSLRPMSVRHGRGRGSERGRPRPQQLGLPRSVRNSTAPSCWRKRCGRGRPRSDALDSRLAGRGMAAILPCDELDRNHPTLAAVVLRGTRADSLGAHSASGCFVDGFRAGTG